MTKVLVITNKTDLTSDFIIKKLKHFNIDYYRFNTEELGRSIAISLDFSDDRFILHDQTLDKSINLIEFTSVYFRRPETPDCNCPGLSMGELNFIRNEYLFTLEGIYKLLRNAYWISPLYSIREAENKIYQLELAKSLGFTLPQSLITSIPKVAELFYTKNNQSCIIKPIRTGQIDGGEPAIVFTSKVTDLYSNSARIERNPTFFQDLIEKKLDIRVTIVGEKIFAAAIDSQEFEETSIDWRRSEMTLKYSEIELPMSVRMKCITLLKALNLKFGAIDFILDKNDRYIFLEINPNGQWAWIERQLNYNISVEIVNLLVNEDF